MPTAVDLVNGAAQLSALNPRWCHSGPDPNNNYLPKLLNTTHGGGLVTNHFVRWVLTGTALPPMPYMNCWEAIFYAAYLAGCVTRESLEVLHRSAAQAARAAGSADVYYMRLMERLDYDRSVQQPSNYNAPVGAIVFIEDQPPPLERFKHVMLCTGGAQRGWSHDISDAQASGGLGGSPRNHRHVTWFTHLTPPMTYVGRWAAFPF